MSENRGCKYGCNARGEILFKGEWVKCPEHGIEKEVKLRGGVLPDGGSIYDRLKIPVEYEGNWVDGEIDKLFNVEGVENCTSDSLNQLKRKLSEVYMGIALDKKVPEESMYLYGAMVDIKPWVYSIQRVAIEQGVGVEPLISVNDLAGLVELQEVNYIEVKDQRDVKLVSNINRLAGQGADWYLYTGCEYVDYLQSDLCIVEDSGITTKENLRVLEGFINERARRNRTTIVVSSVYPNIMRRNLENKGLRVKSKLNFYIAESGRGQERKLEIRKQETKIKEIKKPEDIEYDID